MLKKRDYKILLHHPKAKTCYWELLQKYSRNKAIRKLIKMVRKRDLPEVVNLSAEWIKIPAAEPWPWIEINPYDLIKIRKDVRFIKIKHLCNVPDEVIKNSLF